MSRKAQFTQDEREQHKKDYQRSYYQANREKALAYQKDYNARHKRSSPRRSPNTQDAAAPSSEEQKAFRRIRDEQCTKSEFQHMAPERSERWLADILAGRRKLV